jgi:hypothetical protein
MSVSEIDGLSAIGDTEFGEDIRDVGRHRARADEERCRGRNGSMPQIVTPISVCTAPDQPAYATVVTTIRAVPHGRSPISTLGFVARWSTSQRCHGPTPRRRPESAALSVKRGPCLAFPDNGAESPPQIDGDHSGLGRRSLAASGFHMAGLVGTDARASPGKTRRATPGGQTSRSALGDSSGKTKWPTAGR